eukprot:comp22058_c0_seq1/m.50979 comp22058_c0_seq1/g.50979  ORF comp22058_c0_seq1/g.50979 comp22058_c0_seq1/m.50979 type:complete len:448 (+) comp22058_c0_seq1:1467-2810(+)
MSRKQAACCRREDDRVERVAGHKCKIGAAVVVEIRGRHGCECRSKGSGEGDSAGTGAVCDCHCVERPNVCHKVETTRVDSVDECHLGAAGESWDDVVCQDHLVWLGGSVAERDDCAVGRGDTDDVEQHIAVDVIECRRGKTHRWDRGQGERGKVAAADQELDGRCGAKEREQVEDTVGIDVAPEQLRWDLGSEGRSGHICGGDLSECDHIDNVVAAPNGERRDTSKRQIEIAVAVNVAECCRGGRESRQEPRWGCDIGHCSKQIAVDLGAQDKVGVAVEIHVLGDHESRSRGRWQTEAVGVGLKAAKQHIHGCSSILVVDKGVCGRGHCAHLERERCGLEHECFVSGGVVDDKNAACARWVGVLCLDAVVLSGAEHISRVEGNLGAVACRVKVNRMGESDRDGAGTGVHGCTDGLRMEHAEFCKSERRGNTSDIDASRVERKRIDWG